MRMARDWGLTVLIAVICFFVADRFSGGATKKAGEPAPAFTLANLAGGQASLDEFRGRPVVLNFWATWCGPCRAEIPEFSAYAVANPDVTVLGVVVPRDEGSRLREIVAGFPIEYPVLVATSGAVRDYGVDTFPTTVVVASDGTVASVNVGAMSRRQLEKAVSASRE